MQGQVRFAVDLGTSNTVAVVDRGDGTPRPLLFDGNPLLPSAVFADASGTVLVGRDAERHMATDAARYEPNPKGHVDEGLILLGDREVPVVELLAAILRRVAAEAAQTGVLAGGTTVLTCPADWGPRRRAVLQEAAGVAGLGRVTLLDEPVAAATYCMRVLGSRVAPGRSIAVFDFGGGTLDVTVAQAAPEGLRVLATGGLDDLGGTDVDAALVGHLGQQVAAHDPGLWRRLQQPRTPADFRDRMRFWSEVRAAKEMLSRATTAPVHVPGVEPATHLTREELDRVAGPLVDRAVDETRRVLQRSGVPAGHLDAILLVGGSSRLPLVASRLHARFGLAPVVPEQPELPVAFGALLLGNAGRRRGAAESPTGGGAPTGPTYGTPANGFPASAPPAMYPTPAPPAAMYPTPPLPAAYQQPAVHQQPQRPQRPSVIIGPGVTMQGNVAVYGDEHLMPQYARDDPPAPTAPTADPPARARRSGGGFSISRLFWRLRLMAVPLVVVLALTPWGRGLLSAGRDKIGEWTGSPTASPAASATPSASPSKPAASAAATGTAGAKVVPDTVKAGVPVKLTGTGFDRAEQVSVKVNGVQQSVRTAVAGAVEWSMPTKGFKVGTATVELTGLRSRRTAKAALAVTA